MSAGYGRLAAVMDAPPPSPPRPPDEAFDGAEIARLTGGRLERASDRPIRGAAVDSRRVQPGNLFVALAGERTDGHEHLVEAVQEGAAGLLVSRPGPLPAAIGDVSVIRVPRPLPALHALAAAWRRRFDPLAVGVTGSIAKTSTKEVIAAVLGTTFRTLKNEGNENNEIGLPLTVLRLGSGRRGAGPRDGDVRRGRDRRPRPDRPPRIGVVTAVLPVHLARIGSIEAIETEKGRLVEALPPGGTAVLNADDERVRRMAGRTGARVLTYGFAEDADVERRGGRVARSRRDALRPADAGRPTLGDDPGARSPRRPQRARRRGGRAWRPGSTSRRSGEGWRPVPAQRTAASSSVSAT